MKQKDLAEEYSIKEYKRLNDSEPIFEENLFLKKTYVFQS